MIFDSRTLKLYFADRTPQNPGVRVFDALSGDAHVAGYHSESDAKPGWWDVMVGPGKGIDTDKYFIVCSNIIGSCMGSSGPCTINPKTVLPYGLDFPVVTIGDMVEAQKALIDHLGIKKLLAVVGGSIGGMQVLEWCVRYPEMVSAAVPLASTTKHSALAIAFNEVARQSIMVDPNWNNGEYYFGPKPDMGLAVARMVGHITYLSDESMRLKFGRRLQDKSDFSFNFDADFQVESYLRYQGKNVFVTEVEPRWDITYRWSAVGFAGIGWTSEVISELWYDEGEVAYGLGFRYLMARRMGLRVGLDVARGPEDTVVYLSVGSAWQ